MNRLTIIGNLTRDPETGNTEQGVNWTSFTVAVNRKGKDSGQQEAEFFRVTAWRALGETCAKYLRKGKKVAVVGEAKAHGWTSQNGEARAQIQVTAMDVEFLSTGDGGAPKPTDADAPAWGNDSAAAAAEASAGAQQVSYTEVQGEDVPW